MLAVHFYLLDTPEPEACLLFICRLIEKIYLKNHTLFLLCETLSQAETMDEALWTFRPASFIPHHLQGEGPTPPPPIQIGTTVPSTSFNDILLNMTPTVPPFYTQFKKIIEIVAETEQSKENGRLRYRTYQSAGCQPITHKINTKEFSRAAC